MKILTNKKKKKTKGDALTPGDIVKAVFHEDGKALMKSFGHKAKAKRKKQEKALKKKGKKLKRTFSRTKTGKVSMRSREVNR